MKKEHIKLIAYIAEGVFGALSVATIFEQTHPYLAVLFIALAKGSAAAKTYFLERANT